MNRVFINIEKDESGHLNGKETFKAITADNHVEDIETFVLADPDLLTKQPHEIVQAVVNKDPEVADVIQAALVNGTDIYVNDMPEMDHAAYKALTGNPGLTL